MMKNNQMIRSVLFTLGGALAGLAYYGLIGCPDGSCAVLSHPAVPSVLLGLIGWLASHVRIGGDAAQDA